MVFASAAYRIAFPGGTDVIYAVCALHDHKGNLLGDVVGWRTGTTDPTATLSRLRKWARRHGAEKIFRVVDRDLETPYIPIDIECGRIRFPIGEVPKELEKQCERRPKVVVPFAPREG